MNVNRAALFYCSTGLFSELPSLIFLFLPCRSVSPLRSVAKMYVEIGVVWQPVTWMGRKAPWECPKKPPVPVSCAPNRGLSAIFGTDSLCVSAATAVRENLTLPVPLMA